MELSTNKRVTCRQVRPNALFEDWVANLYEEARSTKSSLEPMLKHALESVSNCPVQLTSGDHCLVLEGFNVKLCKYLNHCLNTYNQNYALSEFCDSRCDQVKAMRSDSPIPTTSPIPFAKYITRSGNSSPVSVNYPKVDPDVGLEFLIKSDTELSNDVEVPDSSTNKNTNGKKKDKSKMYKPAHRSGGYAILVALLEHNLEKPDKSMTKEDLIKEAQKHSEESFVRPKPGTFYTAWSNMTRLVKKGLVEKSMYKKKVVYLLTEMGKEAARVILEEGKCIPTANDIIFNSQPSTSVAFDNKNANIGDNNVLSTSRDINVDSDFVMEPGTFDIILLIDKNETGGLKKRNDPTVAQFKKYPDLNHEYRNLKVGDFTWIARSKVYQDQELVLPFIVERKRMDDLGASIKDGRFHEQKFRLRKCGLHNVIYMVEYYGKNKHVGLPLQTLMQAIANTRVQDGFNVHVTDSLTNSARFLAMMTKRLTIRYKDKHLRGCNNDPEGEEDLMTFEYFNKSSAKTKPLTVTETFIKILLQLKGMSVERALAITNRYPTPRSLIVAYAKCDQKEGESLLAHLKYGDLNRNVGSKISKSIYLLFSN